MARVYLSIVGQEPVQTGRFGCDYAWNDDFTAYRQMPHRWMPGSDSSYAAWQASDLNDYEDEDEGPSTHYVAEAREDRHVKECVAALLESVCSLHHGHVWF